MPVVMICPSCQGAVTVNHHRQFVCPNCRQQIPEALKQTASAALSKDPPRPLLLTIGMVLSLLNGGLCSLFLFLAPLNIGSYSINNEEVTGREFLRAVGVPFGAFALTTLAIGYGLWRGCTWSRPLMLFWWGVVAAVMIAAGGTPAEVGCGLLFVLIFAGIAVWYLYGNKSVRAYYQAKVTDAA